MKAIREGINFVIPMTIVKMLSWKMIETRATGSKSLDIEKLKSITQYNVRFHNYLIILFRAVLQQMNQSKSSGESLRASTMKRDLFT